MLIGDLSPNTHALPTQGKDTRLLPRARRGRAPQNIEQGMDNVEAGWRLTVGASPHGRAPLAIGAFSLFVVAGGLFRQPVQSE